MSGVSAFYRVDLDTAEFAPLELCNALTLKVKEKQIEEWMARNPKLLFSDEYAVMVMAQEVSGELQADLLAVDSQGNLIIIEMKRHWSDRNTVAQLLDYAARLSEWDYESFDRRWKAYKGDGAGDLFEAFRAFVENPAFERADFLKTKRLFILASESDEGLKRIISWLRDEHEVPIDFVPFEFFRLGEEVFLRMDQIDVKPLAPPGSDGDWFFNANETHSPGAWRNMLNKNVVAACGYGAAITKAKMDGPAVGDRVFVYVNGKGVIAVGRVKEELAVPGTGIFNRDYHGDEYHRSVDWLAVAPVEKAVSASTVSSWGYNMPVRCTLGRWSDSTAANQVLNSLKSANSART